MSRIFEDATGFFRRVQPQAPLIGLDLGDKTIGIAVSDVLWTIATPRQTIRRRKFSLDAVALKTIIDDVKAAALVLGLPRNMNGSEGPRCQKTRAFARNFIQTCTIDILLWDERLSTVAAERVLLQADASRAKRAEVIDHVAAGYILQGALDRIAHIRSDC